MGPLGVVLTSRVTLYGHAPMHRPSHQKPVNDKDLTPPPFTWKYAQLFSTERVLVTNTITSEAEVEEGGDHLSIS